jgi:DNA-binding PadR family transcriptional regulator
MFMLNDEENKILKSQIVTSRWGGARRSNPYAFTEQGVAMLSSVLRSKRAVQVNIVIMRAFVKLRQIISTHKDLAHKLSELERKVEKHDMEIKAIFDAIRQLMESPPVPEKPKIGFHPNR